MSKKRSTRREGERKAQKLTRDLERLAAFEAGGSPERAITIVSPSEVEVHVASAKCPLCASHFELREHAAETIGGSRLRIARVACFGCGKPRCIYFRLAGTTLN